MRILSAGRFELLGARLIPAAKDRSKNIQVNCFHRLIAIESLYIEARIITVVPTFRRNPIDRGSDPANANPTY